MQSSSKHTDLHETQALTPLAVAAQPILQPAGKDLSTRGTYNLDTHVWTLKLPEDFAKNLDSPCGVGVGGLGAS